MDCGGSSIRGEKLGYYKATKFILSYLNCQLLLGIARILENHEQKFQILSTYYLVLSKIVCRTCFVKNKIDVLVSIKYAIIDTTKLQDIGQVNG